MKPRLVEPARIEERELISGLLEPHHVVLHVGPMGPFDDPIPLFAGTRLREDQGGKLILLDAKGSAGVNTRELPSAFLLPSFKPEKKVKAERFQIGGTSTDKYVNAMMELSQSGRHGQLIVPFQHYENAIHTSIRPNLMDRIVDRGSSFYILHGNLRQAYRKGRLEQAWPKAANALAKEYYRLLKENGKVVLLLESAQADTDGPAAEHREHLCEALKKAGFAKIKVHDVIPAKEKPYLVPTYEQERQVGFEEYPGQWPYRQAIVATKP